MELTYCTGLSTYLMLWPDDGRMLKEDIRGIYDGSIFYTIAERVAKKKK
jgi:peroxygenase